MKQKIKSIIEKVLPHICIVIAVMLIVFICIDFVNPAMQFIDNAMTKTLILLLAVTAFVMSVMYMIKYFKNDK